jgi:hypothetical protein
VLVHSDDADSVDDALESSFLDRYEAHAEALHDRGSMAMLPARVRAAPALGSSTHFA